MEELKKRTWAEISLRNIVHNMKAIRASLPAGTKYLGVVKANAYGHGAVQVATALEQNGADYLAVACLEEALELRNAGIQLPILILGVSLPEDVPVLIANDITQAVTSIESATAYSEMAMKTGKFLKTHVKVDTGMSRLGFLCDDVTIDQSAEAVIKVCSLPGLVTEGIFTHFAVSDEPDDGSKAYTKMQFERFMSIISRVEKSGIKFAIRHCAATGGTLFYPEYALDMVRPGLLLYGYGDEAGKLGLKPGMSLKTRITALKDYSEGTRISYGGTFITDRFTHMGVIPIGYADGLFRSLSNRASFVVNGSKAPQRGRICMDMCMIDLTDIPGVCIGDEVEIFGNHSSLDELSKIAGTIPYELLCAVSRRVPRIYN